MTRPSEFLHERPRGPRRTLLLLAVPLALALLAACSTPKPAPAPSVAPSAAPIERPGRAVLEVSEAASGARLVLDRAQTLVVALQLPGNQSPDWSLAEAPPAAFSVTGPRFERTARDRNVDEAAGSTVWRFQPAAPGEFSLRFELRRPRSTLPPLQTVTYTVTVR